MAALPSAALRRPRRRLPQQEERQPLREVSSYRILALFFSVFKERKSLFSGLRDSLPFRKKFRPNKGTKKF